MELSISLAVSPLVLHWSWGSNVYLCWRRCYREWKIPRAALQQSGVPLYKMSYTWFTSNMNDETIPLPQGLRTGRVMSLLYPVFPELTAVPFCETTSDAHGGGEREGPDYITYFFVSLGSVITCRQINPFRRSPSHTATDSHSFRSCAKICSRSALVWLGGGVRRFPPLVCRRSWELPNVP